MTNKNPQYDTRNTVACNEPICKEKKKNGKVIEKVLVATKIRKTKGMNRHQRRHEVKKRNYCSYCGYRIKGSAVRFVEQLNQKCTYCAAQEKNGEKIKIKYDALSGEQLQ